MCCCSSKLVRQVSVDYRLVFIAEANSVLKSEGYILFTEDKVLLNGVEFDLDCSVTGRGIQCSGETVRILFDFNSKLVYTFSVRREDNNQITHTLKSIYYID